MTELPRTIAEIWADRERTARWHQVWLEHLRLQGSPDVAAYEQAAGDYRNSGLAAQRVDAGAREAMSGARHEVVAALEAFNERAEAQSAHTGLASSDVVDPVTQTQVIDSLSLVIDHALHVVERIRRLMVRHAELVLLARTHGQPAQLTTYGHRQATVLSPLLDWVDRAQQALVEYPLRPPTGAVGTAADLIRVLEGAGSHERASTMYLEATTTASPVVELSQDATLPFFPNGPRDGNGVGPFDRYASELSTRLGSNSTMDASRQVYHRSYDLYVASLLSALSSIGQTWAHDRRLEAMLGLGNERHTAEQSASSSMPHKTNPRFSERICGLAVVTRGYSNMCAELASMEWLEGDVSTSAARKLVLPAMFQTIDDLLSNWAYVADLWEVDEQAIKDEVWIHRYEWASPAIMQALVDAGVGRSDAHKHLREAWLIARAVRDLPTLAETFEETLAVQLNMSEIRLAVEPSQTRVQLRRVTDDLLAQPIGNVADQIDWLDRRAQTAHRAVREDPWVPEVNP